jgi:hypothetical protein
MIELPSDNKKLLATANELIEQCRVSVGARSACYRLLNSISETGRFDGNKSLINMLHNHLVRTKDHLFSPVELKFSLDFERPQPKTVLDRAREVAKVISRSWERNNTDITFGRGVFEALKYGACILKQWPQQDNWDDAAAYYDKLVLPWQFGVYREDENRLDRQEVLCETVLLTMPEVWRRIWHLPDAKKLMDRIKTHAKHGEAGADPNSYFHQVLSTSQLDTGISGATRPLPGGIVQLNNDPNYAIMGPVIAADTIQMHELWVKDEKDYTTIQLIEPDILIAPLLKKANLLGVEYQQPYRLIQPNEVTNWFWGRSELNDLIEPQGLLSSYCDDAKRMMGLQVDKIIAFMGDNGITDESYGQMRGAGYFNLSQGTSVNDLTPKFPPELLPMMQFVIETINTLGGFPEIMQGKGDAGVRAGVHADTLLKTGSPTLRDRSLLVERQCAVAADLTLQLMEAKDPTRYWLKADEPLVDVEATSFLIADLPDDWRVTVDSHSSSPIFASETSQLILQAAKLGYVEGEYVLDNLPFPNKETAKAQLREKEARQAAFMSKLMAEQPELGQEILRKQVTGKK